MGSAKKRSLASWSRIGLLVWIGLQAGCAAVSHSEPPRSVPTGSQTSRPALDDSSIQTASFQEPASLPPPPLASNQRSVQHSSVSPFADQAVLPVGRVVDEVLARNPSLAQMVAAWHAVAARYPQVTSLEDPMLGAKLGPGSLGSNNVNFAYMFEVSQKLPFPGKLSLRGDTALAEASASGHDVDDMRLQLIESAQIAFYDYYLIERALDVNAESVRLLEQAQKDAESRYRTGKVEQQDMLQAGVEVAREQERRLTLEESRQITIARINTLLHLLPDSPLPPAPEKLQPSDGLPNVHELREIALARRPDLQAIADRIRAEQAALGLAQKDYYPDFEVAAGYDSFWQERELRSQLGVRLNVPLQKARRLASVTEAESKIAQRQAELARQIDQVNYQVQEAYERVRKSEKSVRLYAGTILPDAELNVKAARSAYVAGKIPALSRIEAERMFVGLRDRYHEAVADYFRRKATLERVVGGPIEAADKPQ